MKIIVTADTHLHEWRVPSVEKRIEQYNKLAKWLTEVVYEYGADRLIIAGDVFHTATPTPNVLSFAKDFFTQLSENVRVNVIHGQHDLYTRTKELETGTLPRVLASLGLPITYYHRQFDDDGIYYYGWESNYELPKESKDAVAIITHATVVGSTLASGWKVKDGNHIPPDGPIVFAGDIHQHQDLGRVVIPGPPVQHNRGDSPNVGVILFDTETKEWQFIPTGTIWGERVYHFYALVYDEKDAPAELDPEYILLAKKPTKKKVDKAKTTLLDPLDAVADLAKKENVLDVHKTILNQINLAGTDKLVMDIRLKRLVLTNFMSHNNLELDFDSYPSMNLIVGPNGAGKSSVFKAIKYALTGGKGNLFKTVGASEMSVELEIETTDKVVRIVRGHDKRGNLRIWINNEEVDAPTMSDKDTLLQNAVPAIREMDLWYWNQSALGPLSARTQKERFSLVSRVLGVDVVGKLHDVVKSQVDDLSRKIAVNRATLDQLEKIHEIEAGTKEGELEEVVDSIDYMKKVVSEKIQEVERQINQLDYTKIVSELAQVDSEINQAKSSLKALSEKIRNLSSSKTCPVCGSPLKGEKHTELKTKAMQDITIAQKRLNDGIKRKKELENALARKKENYDKLNSVLSELRKEREKLHEAYLRVKTELEQERRKFEVWKRAQKLTKELGELEKEYNKLSTYLAIVAPNGQALAQILSSASEKLSNDVVRVKTVKTLANGNIKPNFSLEMKVRDSWLDFEYLSGGQKSLAEVTFFSQLANLTDGVGELLLDESFRYLDENAVSQAVEVLRSSGVQRIWLISHHEVVPEIESVISL